MNSEPIPTVGSTDSEQALTASSERVRARPTLERIGTSASPPRPDAVAEHHEMLREIERIFAAVADVDLTDPSSSTCADKITRPPAGVWSMALASRLSTACDSEVSSALIRGRCSEIAVRTSTRCRLASAADPHHAALKQIAKVDLAGVRRVAAVLKPGKLIEFVDQGGDLLARRSDIARIFEIAVMPHRPERFRADQIGKARQSY